MADAVLDASAVLALIHREPGAATVAAALPAAISAVNLAEVVSKLVAEGLNEAAVLNALNELLLDVVGFDREQAMEVGMLRRQTKSLGLSLGDRCCLNLARRLKVPALTTDRAWQRLALGVRVTVVR